MTESVEATLLRLARMGARIQHDWYFDAAENIDVPPNGHEPPFESCPHPDCAAVRAAMRVQADRL